MGGWRSGGLIEGGRGRGCSIYEEYIWEFWFWRRDGWMGLYRMVGLGLWCWRGSVVVTQLWVLLG